MKMRATRSWTGKEERKGGLEKRRTYEIGGKRFEEQRLLLGYLRAGREDRDGRSASLSKAR